MMVVRLNILSTIMLRNIKLSYENDIFHLATPEMKTSIQTLSVISENYLYRSPGSGTSHLSQIGILGYWAYAASDLH